jgi:acyl CoA:acetate/3-ketoacid CoA transferase alpha subunit
MDIAEPKGYHISFGGFMKTACPYLIISILISQGLADDFQGGVA